MNNGYFLKIKFFLFLNQSDYTSLSTVKNSKLSLTTIRCKNYAIKASKGIATNDSAAQPSSL